MPAPSKSEEAVGAKMTSNYTNIAKIGPFGTISDAYAFLWANLDKNVIF